jgi:Holliday junction resolvase RusA-like endonuclease
MSEAFERWWESEAFERWWETVGVSLYEQRGPVVLAKGAWDEGAAAMKAKLKAAHAEKISEISLTVLGDPKAQKRHRTYTKDRHGRALPYARQVDPSATDKADFLAQIMQRAPEKPLDGPLKLSVLFEFLRPQSHFGTGRNSGQLKASAPGWHAKRPDLDNCLKLVKDAMNGVFYRDDAQIVGVDAGKLYGEQGKTTITLTSLGKKYRIDGGWMNRSRSGRPAT